MFDTENKENYDGYESGSGVSIIRSESQSGSESEMETSSEPSEKTPEISMVLVENLQQENESLQTGEEKNSKTFEENLKSNMSIITIAMDFLDSNYSKIDSKLDTNLSGFEVIYIIHDLFYVNFYNS